MSIVDDCRRCEAEFQNELITAFRKGTPREVEALVSAGGRCDEVWRWRALRTLGVVCVDDMSVSHRSIKMAICAVFALCDYKEKREGEPQIVSFLSGVFPVSVMIVISSLDFFL